jgi:hypothetical protein
MTKKLSQAVLQAIQSQHLAPQPRWQVLAREGTIWLACVLLLALAGFVTGVLFQLLQLADWQAAAFYPGGAAGFLLRTLSFTWPLLLVLSTWGAYALFRRTQRGYRFAALAVFVVITLLAAATGSIMLTTSLPERAAILHEERFAPLLERFYQRVEHGVLEGKIVALGETTLTIRGPRQLEFTVSFERAVLDPRVTLEVGTPVRIFGELTTEQSFTAERILPLWRMPHGGRHMLPPQR